MATAMDVAKQLVLLRDNDKKNSFYFTLSNLKLQKLLYYCQGAHFRWDNQPLIQDSFFEAWKYGPVIPTIYHHFKEFGESDIYSDTNDIVLNENEINTISVIWEQLKAKHPFELVKSTHLENPWINAYNQNVNNRIISDESIREYFLGES